MKLSARLSAFFCAGLVLLCIALLPGHCQVRGMYSPGSTLTGGGTVPDPGFSYSNQLWFGSATESKGPNGSSLPLQVSVSVRVDNNTLVYVPKYKLLGANLEFMVDLSFSNGRYSAENPFAPGSTASGGSTGLTNTNFIPFNLGWHFKHADLQTGYSVYAPTGRYVVGATDNVSTGFWTNAWQAGGTFYLTQSKNTQVSVFSAYEWNTTQQGTGVRPGQNESVDYSLSQTFPLSASGKWSLLVGAAGYGQWQTTDNSGQGSVRDALKYGVDAAGLTSNVSSPYKGFYFGAGFLWEYGAKNTFQGRTGTFTAGLQF